MALFHSQTRRRVIEVVCQIYPIELQLKSANSLDTEALILDLDLFISCNK